MSGAGPPEAAARRPLRWWRELVLVAGIYLAYEVSRGIHEGGVAAAMANGRRFLDWEVTAHLDPERSLNDALHAVTPLSVVAAYLYSTTHYLVTPVVLVWLYRRHAGNYRLARTALAIASVSALLGYYFVPTAPPRLLPEGGFHDTLAEVSGYGWWAGAGSVPRGLGGLSNQFAAMPSLHVGWAVWCGIMLVTFGRGPVLRGLGVLYPVVTSLVVMATANHYLLDVVAGVVIVAWGLLAATVLAHVRHPPVRSPAAGETDLGLRAPGRDGDRVDGAAVRRRDGADER